MTKLFQITMNGLATHFNFANPDDCILKMRELERENPTVNIDFIVINL